MPIPSSASNVLPRQDLLGAMHEMPLGFVGIGHELFTPIPVPKDKGSFGSIGRAELGKRAQGIERRPTTGYSRDQIELDEKSYNCIEYGREEVYDDGQRSNYEQQYSYEKVLANRGRRVVMLEEEVRIKDKCHDTAAFTGSTGTLAVTNEWDDATNALPINDVHAGIEEIKNKCGMTADTLQIAWSTWYDLTRTDQLRDALKYTQPMPGLMRLEAIAAALGIGRVVVPDFRFNNAIQGQAASMSEVWTNEYAFLAVTAQGEDIESPCIGRTFHNAQDGGLLFAEQYRDDTIRSDVYRMRQKVDNKRLDTIFGFLFSNITT